MWRVYGSRLQCGCHLFIGQKCYIILDVQLVYILQSFVQIKFTICCFLTHDDEHEKYTSHSGASCSLQYTTTNTHCMQDSGKNHLLDKRIMV